MSLEYNSPDSPRWLIVYNLQNGFIFDSGMIDCNDCEQLLLKEFRMVDASSMIGRKLALQKNEILFQPKASGAVGCWVMKVLVVLNT